MPTIFKATQADGSRLAVDALIYVVGYEERSTFAVEQLDVVAGRGFAVVYSRNRLFGFDAHLSAAEIRGHRLVQDSQANLVDELSEFISGMMKASPIRIGVDISAMNRGLMAEILITISKRLRVDDILCVIYSPAAYHSPTLELIPLRAVNLAHPSLSGAIGDPGKGRCMIMGLGYEYGLSLSVLDRHEPDMSFLFRPFGFDDRYIVQMGEANFDFDFGERNYEVLDYRLDDIPHLYDNLNAIILSSKERYSISCVPFGPKIFGAMVVMTAMLHSPDVAVLRYALSDVLKPVDVQSSGTMVAVDLLAAFITPPIKKWAATEESPIAS